MLERSVALLIDDGELDDVAQLLETLGVRPARLSGARRARGWRPPERLLVVSGRWALELGAAALAPKAGFHRIAVANSPSKTLRARLLRTGFDSLLFRPVHPEVLRLVIAGALHAGEEQRSRARFPAGCKVAWRTRLRRRPGTLTEISARGCRILVRGSRRPPQLSLLLPPGLASQRELRIPGQVVRCERRSGGLVSLSVLFDGLELEGRRQLARFLQSLRPGPLSLAS